MNIITRRSFMSGLSAVAVPAAGVAQEYRDGRYPSRKTPNGLVSIEWHDIKPGDEIVVHDWENCRLVKILAFTACTSPNMLADGMPLESERFIEIVCQT